MAKVKELYTNKENILKAEGQTLAFGILSCVDAGKTTLSKAILNKVLNSEHDYGNISLDSNDMEKKRGITIFSKEINFNYEGKSFVLVDTPGHKDFVWEINRVLPVLDIAILIIPCDTWVNNRTRFLINLLKEKEIPTLIFFNKVDTLEESFESHFYDLRREGQIEEGIFLYERQMSSEAMDEIALLSEELMNKHIDNGKLSNDDIISEFLNCNIYPAFYGSALTGEGIDDIFTFISEIKTLSSNKDEQSKYGFSAYVYKISRDINGTKLCHARIINGKPAIKESLVEGKINEIRKYRGDVYENVNSASPGDIIALTGLSNFYIGKIIGTGDVQKSRDVILPECGQKPGLIYKIIYEEARLSYEEIRTKILTVSDEFPELFIDEDRKNRFIYCRLYGKLQGDMLTALISERFDINIGFEIINFHSYETVLNEEVEPIYLCPPQSVPYVNLELSPGDMENTEVSVNIRNEQLSPERGEKIKQWLEDQLHSSHFKNSASYLKYGYMELKVTLGRGSLNNIEDDVIFKQIEESLYKCLIKSDMALKTPMYEYKLIVHNDDYSKLYPILKKYNLSPDVKQKGINNIQIGGRIFYEDAYGFIDEMDKANTYLDEISIVYIGYEICEEYRDYKKKRKEFKEEIEKDFIHICESPIEYNLSGNSKINKIVKDDSIEQNKILNSIYRKGNKNKRTFKERKVINTPNANKGIKKSYNLPRHTFIDGYNVIFHIDTLNKVAKSDIGASCDMLVDMLKEYSIYMEEPVTIVFDGYKKANNPGTSYKENELEVVYTKTGITADRYIESSVYKLIDKEDITVVTSDRLEQMNVFAQGAKRMSVKDFKAYMDTVKDEIKAKMGKN